MAICKRCKGKLDDNNFCSSCHVSMKMYEKIYASSRLFYNEGLQKAKTRDLSGSVELLNRSIKYDKNNVDARNLLGLVYFEIGEPVLAIQQWVVSQSIQKSNNVAVEYLERIQNSQSNLAKINTAIKKYNQALIYIKQGTIDLALIQLKNVVSTYPNFLKAYCLIALIHINSGDKQKAKRALVNVLEIDRSHYIANKYYEEVTDSQDLGVIVSPDEEKKENRRKARRQVVLNQTVQQFIGVVFGLVIGVAIIYFLYVPDRISSKNEEIEAVNKQLEQAYDDIEQLNADKDENFQLIQRLEYDLEDAVADNDQLTLKNDKVQNLMLSMTSYLNDDTYVAAKYLYAVNIESSTDGILNGLYEQLASIIFPDAAWGVYNSGYNAYYNGQYQSGVEFLELAVRYVRDEYYADDANYYLGRCYQFTGESEKAMEQYKYVLDNFPVSDKRGFAQDYYNQLSSTINN